MTVHLFGNRWYRLYFQLLDSFAQSRCALCFLLSQTEQGLVTTLSHEPSQTRDFRVPLKMLCVLHKSRLKKAATDDAPLLPVLKRIVRDSLRELAHAPKHPAPKWSRWLSRSRPGCPWCGQLLSEERTLCRALIRFLDDTQFWKGFQTAPLLCLDHLEKCLSLETYGKGFERFLNDQSAKLNELLNDLVRLEATGTRGESKRTVLDWLADFAGASATVAEATLACTEADTPAEIFAQANGDRSARSIRDPEALLFENEKLSRKVRGLTQRLNELETRAASLQYRVATLTEDNRRLEMGYTGASTQARGLEKLVRDLTEQIKRLEERNGGYRPKAIS